MAKSDSCDTCKEHSEVSHAVFGDEAGNKGLVKRVSDIEWNIAFVLGVVATVNFVWVFFIYPWIDNIALTVKK